MTTDVRVARARFGDIEGPWRITTVLPASPEIYRSISVEMLPEFSSGDAENLKKHLCAVVDNMWLPAWYKYDAGDYTVTERVRD